MTPWQRQQQALNDTILKFLLSIYVSCVQISVLMLLALWLMLITGGGAQRQPGRGPQDPTPGGPQGGKQVSAPAWMPHSIFPLKNLTELLFSHTFYVSRDTC